MATKLSEAQGKFLLKCYQANGQEVYAHGVRHVAIMKLLVANYIEPTGLFGRYRVERDNIEGVEAALRELGLIEVTPAQPTADTAPTLEDLLCDQPQSLKLTAWQHQYAVKRDVGNLVKELEFAGYGHEQAQQIATIEIAKHNAQPVDTSPAAPLLSETEQGMALIAANDVEGLAALYHNRYSWDKSYDYAHHAISLYNAQQEQKPPAAPSETTAPEIRAPRIEDITIEGRYQVKDTPLPYTVHDTESGVDIFTMSSLPQSKHWQKV